jgi:hypothetical protein
MTFEATLVNRKLITLNSDSQSWDMHPLNVKGCPTADKMVFPGSVKSDQDQSIKTTSIPLSPPVPVVNGPPHPLDPNT